jgi:CoA:oxalate CoA-transferase
MILADLGARVIKVERPGVGDDARQVGPFIGKGEGTVSAYFFSVNRNKESIALDLRHSEDRALFDRMLQGADVLVENFTPGALNRLGYGWDQLHRRHQRLILASISGFGQTGPYRERPAYDVVVQAMGGLMSLTGQPEGPPTRVGVSIGDLAAGLFAAIGVLAALQHREQTGHGRLVDVAMLDCQVALLQNALTCYQVTGAVPGRLGTHHPSIAPFGAFRARDGWLALAATTDNQFRDACTVLGAPELAADPRYATNPARCAHHEALVEVIGAHLQVASRDYWLDRLGAVGLPCGPINDVADIARDPQVRARSMLVDLPIGSGGDQRLAVPGNPIKFDSLPSPLADIITPAPRLDQDRAQLLMELAAAGAQGVQPFRGGSSSPPTIGDGRDD